MDDLSLPVDKAIPCGLILNELISNALKHAFTPGSGGRIRVELRRLPEHRVLLAVSDDGIGIAPDFEPEKSTALGMQLVTTLVEQLDAHLELIRQPGTAFRITFRTEPDK
jgi:two-component sensor histidine kinase